MNARQNPFRVNIGFIVHEAPGYSRTFEFDLPAFSFHSDFKVEAIVGSVKIDRTQKGLVLQAHFSGSVPATCVRCLESYSQQIHTDFTELYAFDNSNSDEEGNLVPPEGYIDLKPVIEEYYQVDIPIKTICKADCKGLCHVCGINRNLESCDCRTEQIDPRLAALQQLLDNKNKEE